MRKTLKIVWNLLTTLIVAAVVLLAMLLVGVRLFGLTPYAVLSGSMEPAYHVGSMIYVKNTAPQEIRVGDPITFVLNEDLDVATHRVVKIDVQNENFYTKGDANDAPDAAPVYFGNLVGKPVFTVPGLGYLSAFLGSGRGMILALSGLAILAVLMILPDLIKKAEKADAAKK